MKSKISIVILVLVIAAASFSIFIVDQTEQAILIQLGKPLAGITVPGIHFKIPFIQEVVYFEKRILDYDAQPTEVLTRDKKNLVVDNYAKWKITDPLTYYKNVRNQIGANARLDDIIYAQLRVELGQHDLTDVVSKTRSQIMARVTEEVTKRAKGFGIEIIDVRIKRADLPEQNEKHVFDRMKAERERQAKQYRSEGAEESQKIMTKSDMEREIILAKAYREAEETKGTGDAESVKIYADAYRKDSDFFEYLRNLEAYKKAFKDKTTFVVSPDLKFLKDLK
ncbi:MAG: protease modulator HflC [Deltaproteobacteria bacterium]|nr:protease modulator HflC [Deltaproteobacteria bacterium]